MSSTSLHDDDVTQPAVGQVAAAPPVEPDPQAAAAVDLARLAAEEIADADGVGEHLGVTAEAEGLVLHSFACRSRGYRGWRWAVSVAHAAGSGHVTVCEVVLLPGGDAVMPPAWVPWADRLEPGDLGAGDELPYRADDPYLVPGYTATDDEDADRLALRDLGLGRTRVLGPEGRDAAAERWYRGSHGPTADVAVQAAASCVSCGYFVPMAGSFRRMFGVCANEWSPSDGKVVSLDHGCGAHSETDTVTPVPEPLPEPILDESGIEPVVLAPRQPADDAADAPATDAPATDAPADGAGATGGTETGDPEATVPGVTAEGGDLQQPIEGPDPADPDFPAPEPVETPAEPFEPMLEPVVDPGPEPGADEPGTLQQPIEGPDPVDPDFPDLPPGPNVMSADAEGTPPPTS